MITSKKNNSLIAFLLAATTFHVHSMEQIEIENMPVSENPIEIIGSILLRDTGLDQLESTSFARLPQEEKYNISNALLTHSTASSLFEAARAIGSLAQVNKELNALINDPAFCLKLIKHMAQRFNCSDMKVCNALPTEAAKKRSKLQMSLSQQDFFLTHNSLLQIDIL